MKCVSVEASCSNFSSTGVATNLEMHSLKFRGGVPLPLDTSTPAAAEVGGSIAVYSPSAHCKPGAVIMLELEHSTATHVQLLIVCPAQQMQ